MKFQLFGGESVEAGRCTETIRQLKRECSGLPRMMGIFHTDPRMASPESVGYIQILKDKVEQMEKDYYQINSSKSKSMIENDEFRMLVRQGSNINTIQRLS